MFCPGFPVGAFPGFESYVTPGVTRLKFVTEGILPAGDAVRSAAHERFSALAGAMGR